MCIKDSALSAACPASQGQPVQTTWKSLDGSERGATLLPEPTLGRVQPVDEPGVQ